MFLIQTSKSALMIQHVRMIGDVYHLWHKPAPLIKQYHDKNLQLLKRYEAVMHNKNTMIDFIREKAMLEYKTVKAFKKVLAGN